MKTEVYEGPAGARCCIRVGVLPMGRESLEMLRSSAEEALAIHRDGPKPLSQEEQERHRFIEKQLHLLISDIDAEITRGQVRL